MDKETWEMDDRKMASMAQFMVETVGGAAITGYALEEALQ
jgi:hypothetical protein